MGIGTFSPISPFRCKMHEDNFIQSYIHVLYIVSHAHKYFGVDPYRCNYHRNFGTFLPHGL